MEEKVRLKVLGLSYSRLKNAAYMLILKQAAGPVHINMWIGEAEAHSIAIAMEGIHPPRPLTHDLFASFIHAFGVRLQEVFIYKVEDDIYASELVFSDGERTVTIDSRTSDAIAIAMRADAPIYTTREILESKGFLLEVHEGSPETDDTEEQEETDEMPLHRRHSEIKIENLAVEELEKLLNKLIEQENYEEAARVNEILQQKKNGHS